MGQKVPLTPARKGQTVETLSTMLDDLQQVTDDTAPRGSRVTSRVGSTRLSQMQPGPRPATRLSSRLGVWLAGAGMLAACAGIAIPLRTFIFERTGGEAAPAAVASRAPEPAKASLPTTAPRSDRADVARTAAVAPPAPQKVEAALPPVEAPAPFLIGETQRPAPSAIAPAPAPIATAQAPASPVPATEPSAPPAVTLVPLAPPRAKPEPPSTRVAAVGDVNVGPSRPPAPGAGRASFDATRLLARAEELIQAGDISAARLMLERAMQSGSAAATFRLAETFDPQVLAQWQTRGIKGDVERARELYARALANGIADSKLRIEALR